MPGRKATRHPISSGKVLSNQGVSMTRPYTGARVPSIFRRGGWVVFGAAMVAGCGQQDIYPVHGVVVDPQGQPLTELKGSRVIFENREAKSSAMAAIDADGGFWLTTLKPKDGA